MRLLSTGPYLPGETRFEVKTFNESEIPDYAILSHVWIKPSKNRVPVDDDFEIVFDNIGDLKAHKKRKASFRKLELAFRQAQRDGWGYIWIDTICIDKSSSAELTEAINSMYEYYSKAKVCYTYLADVSKDQPSIAESEWFTRGWTLQELIAPRNMHFYSAEWKDLGDKISLRHQLSAITKIDMDVLENPDYLESISVAKRMSWVANRDTTRREDMAYCLMGIFSVNFPLLYGEGGQKAFLRLQEEIIKTTSDHTIFAWTDGNDPSKPHGLLADSPKAFKECSSLVPYVDYGDHALRGITSRGLEIDLHLYAVSDGVFAASLNCPVPPSPGSPYLSAYLAIFLEKLPTGHRQYVRVRCDRIGSVGKRGNLETIFVRQRMLRNPTEGLYPVHRFQLNKNDAVPENYTVETIYQDHSRIISMNGSGKAVPFARTWLSQNLPSEFEILKAARALTTAIVFRRNEDDERFALLMGSKTGLDVGFDVVADDALPPPGVVSRDALAYLQQFFNPQPPNSAMMLRYHRVLVEVKTVVEANIKRYVVDIGISPIFERHGLAAVVEVAADVVGKPLPEQNVPTRSRFRRILRL